MRHGALSSLFLAGAATLALAACGGKTLVGPTDDPTPPPGLTLQTGDVIALRADNGKFLSRIHRSGIDPIEASKDGIDAFCRFLVTAFGGGQIALRADEGQGRFLSRIHRSGIDPIEAAKTSADSFSRFAITVLR